MSLVFKTNLLFLLFLTLISSEVGLCQSSSLPPLSPLPRLRPVNKSIKKRIVRRRIKKQPSPDWEYRFSAIPSLEYIGGSKTLSERGGIKSTFYYMFGNWTLYSEGFLEKDIAPEAKIRRSQNTSALQELHLSYKFNSFLFKLGRQPLRWSETWTLPSLDGWTKRRYNRLFFDQLSEQLIHPTGILLNWSDKSVSTDLFYNMLPAEHILPKPLPNTEQKWKGEWGGRGKIKFSTGLDAELIYFDKTDRSLYGTVLSYATDSFVPKLEIGKDSKNNQFAIFGLDSFFGKFSLLPRFTLYTTAPAESLLNNKSESGYNFNLTVRWDSTATWLEGQGFHDDIMKANFYSLRYGVRFSKIFDFSLFAQKYEGKKNTLFGLYQSMTGDGVLGTKLSATF